VPTTPRLASSASGEGGDFDRVAVSAEFDDDRGVVEVAAPPVPAGRLDGLEHPAVEPHGVTTRAERNPIQIHRGAEWLAQAAIGSGRKYGARWRPGNFPGSSTPAPGPSGIDAPVPVSSVARRTAWKGEAGAVPP